MTREDAQAVDFTLQQVSHVLTTVADQLEEDFSGNAVAITVASMLRAESDISSLRKWLDDVVDPLDPALETRH
jgi:hypothetical protein